MREVKTGLLKERAFAADLVARWGGVCRYSRPSEDAVRHIDIYWQSPNGYQYSFDVKGARKNRRHDTNVDYTIHWVELRNVRGGKGWLFGDADYFAFESERDWIIVPRQRLQAEIKEINPHTEVVTHSSPKLYQYYQRDGRKDLVIKIATLDLMNIARVIIPRNVCESIIIK